MADQVVLAIGDACGPPDDNQGARQVARLAGELLAQHPEAMILLLGDNAYPSGSKEDYEQHFRPVLGDPFAGRLRACPGNHDYRTGGAAPYFAALGPEAAGTSAKSYYSFAHGGWHVVSLNSEVEQDHDSPQLKWLREDLANRTNKPILAFWHRARWGSGGHRDSKKPRWFWKELFEHRAEVVLNGHSHHYERFAPQTPSQVADATGIRQFIVGSGGRNLKRRTKQTPHSEFTDFENFGLLQLTLGANAYRWEFVGIDGTVKDQGQQAINR
jgi:hypothetical protein